MFHVLRRAIRTGVSIGAILLAALCALPSEAIPHRKRISKSVSGRTIVAGKSIGIVKLASDADRLPSSLGKSVLSEGAAGHIWDTFRWNGGALDVYSVLAADGPHRVRQLRTTSKLLHTPSGISTGKTFGQVKRRYPRLLRLATYLSRRFGKKVVMYDDVKHGIAFEILRGGGRRVGNANRCVSILIHAPGKRANQETLSPVNYPPPR